MPVATTKPENSYRFVDGRLRIQKTDSEMIIQGWGPPQARRRGSGSQFWESFLPEFQLVRPYRKASPKGGLSPSEKSAGQQTFDFFSETVHHTPPKKPKSPAAERKKALDSFRFSLPKEVAHAVEPFRFRQWLMIQLLHEDPGAIDLAKSNPALGFMLALKLNGDSDLIRSLKCSSMRQREILELLEFPASKASVKLIGKIEPASITNDNWRSMMTMLQTELGKKKTPLCHVSKINLGVMEIVVDPLASVAAGAGLLEEVANEHREKYRGRAIHMITSTLEMQEELQTKSKVSSFPNLNRLCEVHSRVSSQYRRRVRQLRSVESATGSGAFPKPPFEGIPGQIEPITNPRALVDEGEEQGNCVASYASKVVSGSVYIYRVMGRERCTLSIVQKKKNRPWEIGELESKYNTPASTETEDLVAAWLDRHVL